MKTSGIIPARLESSRLPRKMLLAETGKPLIQYAWEQAGRATRLSDVRIATDSEELAAVVRGFGGRVEMTGPHPSGSDRIAEVVRRAYGDADLIVNVQGDEPEIEPGCIDRLIEVMAAHPNVEMGTLATPIREAETLADPSCVKVVCAADGRALYFSRAAIPFCRDRPSEDWISGLVGNSSPWLLHLGIYAYRPDFLLRLTAMPRSRLEQLESLEQLRALEAGTAIQVAVVEHGSVGIDTPEDYARFVARRRG